MSLTIENATHGYDNSNMKSTLEHVHNDCVQHAKDAMRLNIEGLRKDVRACWVGQSADNFMDNMQHDVDQICDYLDQAYNNLEAEFNKVAAGIATIDQELVTKR